VNWSEVDNSLEYALEAERMHELHKPIPHPYQDGVQLCSNCGNEVDGSWTYPCPTIKALDGEQE